MILVTSDLQFSDNPRDEYRYRIGKTISQLIEKYNVGWLYLLGDLTEAKDGHPAELVNRVVNMIHKWADQCDVVILQGNHDVLDTAHPFFKFLHHFEGIRWIDKPQAFNNALWLPHTRDYKRDWHGFDLGGYIFAHNIFEGVRAGNGTVLDGIPLNIFADDTVILAGDVHEPQSFDCVTYVGSPYRCDFGDDYEPRVLLLDEHNEIVKSIPVHGPQKRLIECAAGKGLLDGWKADKDDIIKVRVQLQTKHVQHWSEIRDSVSNWSAKHGFILYSVEPVVNYTPEQIESSPRFSHKTDEQYLREYAARRGLDEIMVKTGLKMLE